MSQRNKKISLRSREERQAEPIGRDTEKNKLELAKLIGDDIKMFEEQGIDLDDLENIAHGKMIEEEEVVATTGLPQKLRDIIDSLFINIAVHTTNITRDINILDANQSRVGKKILAIATLIAQYMNDNDGMLPKWTKYLDLTSPIISRTGGKKSKKYRKKSKKNRKKTKKHHKRKSRKKRR